MVECKAAHEAKELDPAHVRKFFTETVPAVLKVFPEHQELPGGDLDNRSGLETMLEVHWQVFP